MKREKNHKSTLRKGLEIGKCEKWKKIRKFRKTENRKINKTGNWKILKLIKKKT